MAARRLPHFEVIHNVGDARLTLVPGGWFFRIVAPNGKTLAHSEQYRRRAAAERACRAINPHLQIKVIR